MKQFATKAIVLSRTDYAEADRILTFLTPETGKVRAIAKGVRRQKSKLAGGIELFSISDITYIKGKSELHTLVSTRLEKHFGDIVKDINRTMLGYDMLKILTRVLEDEGGSEYYNLLVSTFGVLDNLSVSKDLAEASFLLQLMQLLGHLPNLTHDVRGGDLPSDSNLQFSFDDVAFFASENGPFTQNHIKLLRLLTYNSPEQLVKVEDLSRYLSELIPLIRTMSRQYVVSF
jgi:DNA repair protein RecO